MRKRILQRLLSRTKFEAFDFLYVEIQEIQLTMISFGE